MKTDPIAHTPQAEVPVTPEAAADPMAAPSAFKKLLVALDRTNESETIVARALALAAAHQSQILFFYSLPLQAPEPNLLVAGSMGFGSSYTHEMLQRSQQWIDEERQQALSWLRGLSDRAIAQGLAAEFECRNGEPGQQVCMLAKGWGADLILLGRRGRTGLSEIVLGSVSNYVVHHAPCSVLVIQ